MSTTEPAGPLPATSDDLRPEWLTDVFRADGTLPADGAVATADAVRMALDTGFSSELHRVTLTGDDGLPPTVVVKLPTTSPIRAAMDLIGGYAREVAFYAQIGNDSPLRVPTVHAAAMASDSTDFVLVLEDLAAWDNGSHLAGLSFARARRALKALAEFHAWSAQTDDATGAIRDGFPSLDNPVTRQGFPLLFAEGWAIFEREARAPIPGAIHAFAGDFGRHIGGLLDRLTSRAGLIHGDIRADNIFFRGDEIAFVDFQMSSRGAGMADVGYLVSQALDADERAGRDEELLREYLDVYHAAGGPTYEWADAWRDYQASIAFYLLFPMVAFRAWDGLPPDARELCLRIAERSIRTIEDNDVLSVLA